MSELPLPPSPEVQPPGRYERRDTKLVKKRDTSLLTGSSSLRVLLLEDDPDVADAVAALLRAWGHEVCAMVDGSAALPAALTFLPDVVLSEIGLPAGMDGCEVARQFRGRVGLLIALSGGGQESRQRAFAAGFDYFLAKPCNFQELRRLLGTVTRRR
jgi:DNA-binding response OmpR family regulator